MDRNNRQSSDIPEPVAKDDEESLAERLRVNGFVLLNDVIPLDLIREARDAFLPLLKEKVERAANNRGKGRHHIVIPFTAPFNSPLLYANERVLPIIRRVLGPDCAMGCYASDTPLPGTDYQPIHRDEPGELFPEAPGVVTPPYELTLNIPLQEVTEELAPMELWPGGTQWVPNPQRIEQVASGMHSYKATMRPGSVLLRELRTWHRGTPNRGNEPRAMLALAYTRPWFRYFHVEPVCVEEPVWEQLSESSRHLLRFSRMRRPN